MYGSRPPASRDARRERLVGLLLLGVAVVLLVSSVTWFSTGQTLVGIGQLVLGRRARRRGRLPAPAGARG